MSAQPVEMPSWDQVRAAIGRIAKERGEWAGLPMPVKDMRMVIHPSYPFVGDFEQTFMPDDGVKFICRAQDVEADTEIRNEFCSFKDGRRITIWRDGKHFYFSYGRRQNQALMVLNTLGAARAWDVDAEIAAMEKLRRHVTGWAFECYFMTGSFLETSNRSGVTYLFRRLRPTLAISSRPDHKDRDVGLRILCGLCAHPVGYYADSWAGALVPTDDVIAHLLMMRGDEAMYWRTCNQHQPWAPEAGL